MSKDKRNSLNSNGTMDNRRFEVKQPHGSALKLNINPYSQIDRPISPGLNPDEKSFQTNPQTNLATIYSGTSINQVQSPSTGVADLQNIKRYQRNTIDKTIPILTTNSENQYTQNKRFNPSNLEPSGCNIVDSGVNSNNNPSNPKPLPQTPIQSYKGYNIPFNNTQTDLLTSNIPRTTNPQTNQLLVSSELKNPTILNQIPLVDSRVDISAFNSSELKQVPEKQSWTAGVLKYKTLNSPVKEEQKQPAVSSQKSYSTTNNPAIHPKVVISDKPNSGHKIQSTIPISTHKLVPEDNSNLVLVSPSKAEVRKVNNFSRARDYTSIDAQNFGEAGLNYPVLMNYDANSKTFLEKIIKQDYSGFDNSWRNYLQGLKKELKLVDSILATGGSGQGETLTITKESGSNFLTYT